MKSNLSCICMCTCCFCPQGDSKYRKMVLRRDTVSFGISLSFVALPHINSLTGWKEKGPWAQGTSLAILALLLCQLPGPGWVT